jgi:hypothetical protein
MDWQTAANIASSLAVLVAVLAFMWEVHLSRKERAFSVFLKLVDFYGVVQAQRRNQWKLIKDNVRGNPKTAHEVGDTTISFDYLLTRVKQTEPLYAIEHGLLEDEIRSLNLLDELCRYALKDLQMAIILKTVYASEISFYQNRLKDLLFLRDSQRRVRLFSVLRCNNLQGLQVSDYFEGVSRDDA